MGILMKLADIEGIVLRFRKVCRSVPGECSGAGVELIQTWRGKPYGAALVFQHIRNKVTGRRVRVSWIVSILRDDGAIVAVQSPLSGKPHEAPMVLQDGENIILR